MQMWPIVKKAVQKTAGVAKGVGKAICFLHVTTEYLCSCHFLEGPSMIPTFNLNHDNVALAESISTRLGKVGRGDVVCILNPEDPTMGIAKRIRAVEGDVLVLACAGHPDSTFVVPKGHVWVEGDNPHESTDSRHFGVVPYAHIKSRIFLVVWPPSECRLIGNKIERLE